MISTYQIITTDYDFNSSLDIQIYDVKLNFQYMNFYVEEHMIHDPTKSKICSNCYLWNYKINLLVPLKKKYVVFSENKCGSKLLLSDKIPVIINDLYKQISLL